jgi:hypothetical protein
MGTKFKKGFFLFASAMLLFGAGFSFLRANDNEVVGAKAAATLYTEADFTKSATPSSTYTSVWTYDTDWTIYGGANNNALWNYMKFGVKSKSSENYIVNKIAFDSAISQVSFDVLDASFPKSGMNISSYLLEVYSDSGLENIVDSVNVSASKTDVSGKTLTISPSTSFGAAEWPTNSFYKLIFNLENTSTTNGVMWVSNVKFYKESSYIPVSTITIDSPTSSALEVGNNLNLIASISPSDATNKNVIWETSDSTKAIVSNGVVTAISNGEVQITAKSEDDNTKTDEITLQIINQDLSLYPKQISSDTLVLSSSYIDGYKASNSIVYNTRRILSVSNLLQFGTNETGNGRLYNVSEFGAAIDKIILNISSESAQTRLFVGNEANPMITEVDRDSESSFYNVGAMGDYKFFTFMIDESLSSGTNKYNQITITLKGGSIVEAEDLAQNWK